MTEVMDFPQGWAFVRATDPLTHDPRCSWRVTTGALLCDCFILWGEYARRKNSMTNEKRVDAKVLAFPPTLPQQPPLTRTLEVQTNG